jgi:hypothetical protein
MYTSETKPSCLTVYCVGYTLITSMLLRSLASLQRRLGHSPSSVVQWVINPVPLSMLREPSGYGR